MFSWLLAAALALPGPAVVVAPDPIPRSEVMAMPPELRAQVHAIVIGNDASPTQRFQRLMNFVVDGDGLGMTYEEDATYTVAQAYATRKANCLTFTLLVWPWRRKQGSRRIRRRSARRCRGARSKAPSIATTTSMPACASMDTASRSIPPPT